MKRSDELRDLKAQKVSAMRSVADGAKGRQLTAEERTNYDNLKKEIEALIKKLRTLLSWRTKSATARKPNAPKPAQVQAAARLAK
jgi:hypothetical protein